jgi:hypothetical protein
MQYAGHSKFFVKGRKDLLAVTGFPEYSQVKEYVNQDGFPYLIDMLPLETFDFMSVSHPWGKRYYSEKALKENSVRYYDKNLDYLRCDTFNGESELNRDQRHKLMNMFMNEFKNYVLDAVGRKKYRTDIMRSKLKLESLEDKYTVETCLGDEIGKSSDVDLHMIYPNMLMDQILVGKINWENSYIGCEGVFRKNPLDRYNGDVVRWMAMFGYVYQNRLAPKQGLSI